MRMWPPALSLALTLTLAGCETRAPLDMMSSSLDMTSSSLDLTGAPPGVMRFTAIADYGTDDDAERSTSVIAKALQPDFLITLGDNNYEYGRSDTIDRNIGKYYGEYIGQYQGSFGTGSPTNRFWPSVGNHDWNATPAGSMQPYFDYFPALPGNRRYYDFVVGNVHFFALDSDQHEPDGITFDSVQGQWLHDRLTAATECYKVVYFHHPAYSSGDPAYTVTQMRWPFHDWGADLVLSGHQHQYERMEIGGLTYVVAGLGGALNRFDFFATQPGSVIRFNSAFGALRATVDDAGLHFEFVDTDALQVDTFTIAKECR